MNHAADQQLVEAVQAGDEAAVAQALADGADPDAAVSQYRGPVLIEAAHNGRLGIVGQLVDAGARVGPFGYFHVTPLRVAMLEAHADVVQYLIAHGALRAESTTRTSVLTEAVSYTRHRPRPAAVATLRVLLEAGATPHPGEEAPLITAVMRQREVRGGRARHHLRCRQRSLCSSSMVGVRVFGASPDREQNGSGGMLRRAGTIVCAAMTALLLVGCSTGSEKATGSGDTA